MSRRVAPTTHIRLRVCCAHRVGPPLGARQLHLLNAVDDLQELAHAVARQRLPEAAGAADEAHAQRLQLGARLLRLFGLG